MAQAVLYLRIGNFPPHIGAAGQAIEGDTREPTLTAWQSQSLRPMPQRAAGRAS
ncbi:hypothetical protein GUA87_02605 [Sneathiella sp. P13V-1]|uniref:hypothetical protein n=1 Tax=Sneathiella sp. P13V-1 TaxID=2697366 RepID=UPI00187B3D5C|nr:hypothetical protein [Sneathiella sp. P13V-1]MBE7635721.1 hypothetical protein [Sneathiella sp. P13V-1]